MNYAKRSSGRINDKLVIARLTQHMSQQQVADYAGIDRGYYTKIENGQCVCSIKTIRKIAIALGYCKWRELIQ